MPVACPYVPACPLLWGYETVYGYMVTRERLREFGFANPDSRIPIPESRFTNWTSGIPIHEFDFWCPLCRVCPIRRYCPDTWQAPPPRGPGGGKGGVCQCPRHGGLVCGGRPPVWAAAGLTGAGGYVGPPRVTGGPQRAPRGGGGGAGAPGPGRPVRAASTGAASTRGGVLLHPGRGHRWADSSAVNAAGVGGLPVAVRGFRARIVRPGGTPAEG